MYFKDNVYSHPVFECIICPDGDICPARSVGLVRYPATLAPVDGTDDASVYCADNAHITGSAQTVTCTANGDWTVPTPGPECECDTGYESATVDGVEICQG